MEINEFWDLIEQSRAATKDSEDRASWLAARLVEGPVADVVDFDVHRQRLSNRAFRWPLWGAAYLIGGGCSDDGFDYFRAWVIGLGPDVFERVIADPDSLADLVEVRELAAESADDYPEWEDLLNVPHRAYELLTGQVDGLWDAVEARQDLDDADFSPNPVGDEWDFDDAEETARRLPRLSWLFRG
ncbi:DUF4240 domain-containing protein [Planotetraspora sp. A-T 1434]|uniref:DUF4240 domain-containing protein n=1 Tax=Planotetraspora sp. A-T 1434 TaxID=2979219 RepID=UPI0021BEB821|nr:DUF4240 domain-containing protein [Planotetraspora sp. A-T 1434]MCT9934952.1 DUF4240 domain-containing protein [Planotetraspora sp. A-T 1434]